LFCEEIEYVFFQIIRRDVTIEFLSSLDLIEDIIPISY